MPNFLKMPLNIQLGDYSFSFLNFRYGTYSGTIPKHFHGTNMYEMNYVVDGNGTLISNGNTYQIKPGVFYLNGPGMEHSQMTKAQGTYSCKKFQDDDTITDYCIVFQMKQLKYPSKERESMMGDYFHNMQFLIAKDNGDVLRVLQEIKEECAHAGLVHEIKIKGLLMQILAQIVQYTAKEKTKEQMMTVSQDAYLQMLIEGYFLWKVEDLTIEKLAEHLQYSTRQVQRILKENYGKTFRELKNYYAITQAAEMLLTTDKSIEEVTTHYGYFSADQFKSAFREQFGMNPSEYRAKNK
ncbi:MAG: AraC family transcriptional regulator [Lachnospiraceae bacterium]